MSSISVYGLLEASARRAPDAMAIAAPGRPSLSYAGLLAQVQSAVRSLNALGLGRGDRVATVLPDGPEAAVTFLAVAAGAASAPLNPSYRADELEYYLRELRVKALIVQTELGSVAKAVAQARGIPIIELFPVPDGDSGRFTLVGDECVPARRGGLARGDEVALLLATSGTTARPKIVPLTHANIGAGARDVAASLNLHGDDRCLNLMPLFHIHGLIGGLLSSLAADACVVCPPGFYAPEFFTWLEACHPTWYTAVPTMHQAILARAERHRNIVERCTLRLVRSASAPLPAPVLKELEATFRAPVIEAYGMTEAAHQITSNPLPPRERRIGSVGLPTGPNVAIADGTGKLLPPGAVGEVVIRGANVTSGYDNHADTNAGAFWNGWLRTGDLGYLDSDGYLFLTGRLKDLINRGGEKVSPAEVDQALAEHPAIAQVMTFAVPDAQLGEDIAAAVVLRPDRSASERELREFASVRLAPFKVPRRVVFVDEIPTGPTGKALRSLLAKELGLLEQARPEPRASWRTPETSLQQTLIQLWDQVLDCGPIGIDDNFFELGGDSISATRLVARLREALRVEVPLLSIFEEASTVAGMALFVERLQQQGLVRPLPALEWRPRGDNLPLSFAQERLWFLDQLHPHASTPHIQSLLRLQGPLDRDALERSLTEIVRRHEALRTTFVALEGSPRQVIAEHGAVELPLIDFRGCPEPERIAAAERLASDEVRRPFDLARDLLLRARLLRLADQDHLLLMILHHIAGDAWSMGVLFQELAALYEAFSQGRAAPLPERPIQYADFAIWQREWLRGEMLENQLAYWRQRLASAPPILDLPTDRPRPAVQTFQGARESLELPDPLTQALQTLSRREGATLFMTLLAALKVLLHRYTGQTDVVIGAPVAGRTLPEVEGLIGLFLNNLVLRTDLSGNPSFRELLARVRETCLSAYDHQDVPFERLLEDLQPERNLSHTPLFQVSLNSWNVGEHTPQFAGLQVEQLEGREVWSNFDITVYLRERNGRTFLSAAYRTDIFAGVRIAELLRQLEHLLSQFVAAPDVGIDEVSLVTSSARTFLPDPTRTLSASWEGSVQSNFVRQARRAPEQPAVVDANDTWSYGELDARSNQLARCLLRSGIAPGEIVAISGHRDASLVLAVLGVLKAGAAFTILDPAYPAAHLVACLQVAVPSAWLQLEEAGAVPEALEETLAASSRYRLILPAQKTATSEQLDECSSEALAVVVEPDSLAYISFTSGSTGTPKAVLGRHGPLSHFLPWQTEQFGLSERDRYSMLSGLSHDPLQRDIFTPLQLGATICIPGPGDMRSSGSLGEWAARAGISIAHLTPALLQLLIGTDADAAEATPIRSLRWAFVVGDILTRRDAARLKARAPGVTCVNYYGATETQRAVGYFVLPDAWLAQPGENQAAGYVKEVVPLGQGIQDVQLLVLNSSQQLAGIGEIGEIYVRSPHLASGYLGDPALTAERFLANWFTQAEGDRLYRSGDLGRYLPDGAVEPLGRRDSQVKIRSYRVELGEVEVALSRHQSVAEAVVVAHEMQAGDRRLVAYVVPRPGQAPAAGELRTFLREHLPEYMVPVAFLSLEALPLTPNGKLDRRALPAPDLTRDYSSASFVAPGTLLERRLARIWTDLLGLEQVGIHDDFFEVGGHSILAVQLLARIEATFDTRLPLASLFQGATIERLAELVHQQPAAWPSLVPLQTRGSKPPFFCVHSLTGDAAWYALGRALGPDQPLYGLRARGLDGVQEPLSTIEEMAAYYIQEIRALQPEGPYYLGGYSAGGKVAYEIARQLIASGQEVALLAMIDARAKSGQRESLRPTSRLKSWLQGFIFVYGLDQVVALRRRFRKAQTVASRSHLEGFVGMGWRRRRKLHNGFRELRKLPVTGSSPDIDKVVDAMAWLLLRDRAELLPDHDRRVIGAFCRALTIYRPKPYAGRVELFRTPSRSQDGDLGWGALAAGGVGLHDVRSRHTALMRERHVHHLARELKQCLDEAQARSGVPRFARSHSLLPADGQTHEHVS